MKVLFDHPNPFLLAHGGFQIQIEQTKRGLEANEVEVDWLKWWDDQQNGDVIHYFGRPHPAYIRQAQAKGVKVVMSELLTGLGSRGWMTRKIQKAFISATKNLIPNELTARLSWESYQIIDACIAGTNWEKKLMVDMFAARLDRAYVVPNGVEDVFFLDSESKSQTQRSEYLICAATITERKRVVELAEAATIAKVPVWIIGEPYSEKDPYFLKFISTVENSKGVVKYVGGFSDRAEMARIYQSAAGFVLLSAMETRSLSAEEAAAGGCPLLLSDLPWARSVFGPHASYCPVTAPRRTAGHLEAFKKNITQAPRFKSICTWHQVGQLLADIYRNIIQQPTPPRTTYRQSNNISF